MLKKKINSIIERTKVLFEERKKEICLGALGVVLVGTIGFAAVSLTNTDSKEVASNGAVTEKVESNKDKADKNTVTTNKNDKKEENKKEENKKEESNSSDSTKVEGTNTSTENDKVASNEETSSSGSSSSGSSSGSGSSSSGSSNGGGTSNPPANSHSHSWNPIYDTIHHEEVGHWEDVLIQEGYVEYVPIYEEQEVLICNGCGKDITADPHGHLKEQMLAGNMQCSGFSTDYRQVQVGTEEVKHGPVYDKKYVVDKAAWDEIVTTGYQCSCGATK